MNIRKFFAAALIFSMPLGLAACSQAPLNGSGQSEAAQSETAASSENMLVPEVDRSGKANFPEVSGGFGEKPVIKPGQGDEPTVISVRTLHEGNGQVVSDSDYLSVNYAGVLWDGTPFDSSFDRGEPAAFSLNGVIAGWKYGLAGQKVGDRVELVIPSTWGYGEQGTQNIPGGATLVFVVDILDVTDVTNTDALTQATDAGAELPQGVTVEGRLGEAPKLVFAPKEAVTEQQSIVLAKGAGEKITADQQIIVRTVGAAQGHHESNSEEWKDPQVVPVQVTGLEGNTVGSRILMMRPGASAEQPAVAIVVDIAGVVKN